MSEVVAASKIWTIQILNVGFPVQQTFYFESVDQELNFYCITSKQNYKYKPSEH
jgi:hypothetical protein